MSTTSVNIKRSIKKIFMAIDLKNKVSVFYTDKAPFKHFTYFCRSFRAISVLFQPIISPVANLIKFDRVIRLLHLKKRKPLISIHIAAFLIEFYPHRKDLPYG